MMKFELRLGMMDEDIYERIMGKVSGESSRQVQQFYYPKDLEIKDKPRPLHEVIMADDKYAVIRKHPSMFGLGGDFLTGINDEGTYFIHDLEIKSGENLGDILKRVNRLEHGFQRIQGDILMKTSEINPFVTNIRRQSHSIFKRKLEIKDHLPLEFTLPKKEISTDEDITSGWRDRDSEINFRIMTKGNESYGWNWSFGEYGSENMFSSHKLKVIDGFGYANRDRTVFIAIGQKAVLTHREHMQVELPIPVGKALVFVQQQRPKQQRMMSD